jgi:excisionase family DNA binding protein
MDTPSLPQEPSTRCAPVLQIPRTRCYELVRRGELPAVRIGERSIRVNRLELEIFLLENRRVGAQ